MIEGMFQSGSMPVLERLVQFTAERHRLIAHNIANLSTPNFRPADLSVDSFQRALGRAIDQRRRQAGGPNGPLAPADTPQVDFHPGGLTVRPRPPHENLLFHDRNDRSLERLMQKLAENTMAHNTALELLRNQFDLLERTIREQA